MASGREKKGKGGEKKKSLPFKTGNGSERRVGGREEKGGKGVADIANSPFYPSCHRPYGTKLDKVEKA